MTRKRIYVAGAYSADNVIDLQANMRRGIALSLRVLLEGYAPFCPWLDFEFGLFAEVTLAEYYEYSLAWLEVSDAMLVMRQGLETSHGTQAEMRFARERGIPVFYDDVVWPLQIERHFREDQA